MKITVGGYAALGIGEVEPLDLIQSGRFWSTKAGEAPPKTVNQLAHVR